MSDTKRQRTSGGSTHARSCDSDDLSRDISLTVDLSNLFDNPTLSDVTLVVSHGAQQRRFRCHKVVLASMSTYFHSLFASDQAWQETKQSEVVLQDVDPEHCEHVLRLLYGQAQPLTPQSLLTLVHLADFYGVQSLRRRTEHFLVDFITVEKANCCAKLVEATTLGCTHAADHCKRVLLSDFASAVRQPAFGTLELSVLKEVLDADQLCCDSEDRVLAGLGLWWDAQQPQPEAGTLDDLMALIRWPLLSTDALSGVENRHPHLAKSSRLPALLLEGFKFHSADASTKSEMRRTLPRCRPRSGMLVLAPLLPEGAWQWPPGFDLATLQVPPAGSSGAPSAISFPPSLAYVWNIPHFSSLSCLSMYSPPFLINGHPWKIYIYPKGNNNGHTQLSVYLDSGIVDSHDVLLCTFKLAVINYRREQAVPPVSTASAEGGGSAEGSAAAGGGEGGSAAEGSDEGASTPSTAPTTSSAAAAVAERSGVSATPLNARASVLKESQHSFTKRAKDWGFREFMPLSELCDASSGFLNEGTLTLGVWMELTGQQQQQGGHQAAQGVGGGGVDVQAP